MGEKLKEGEGTSYSKWGELIEDIKREHELVLKQKRELGDLRSKIYNGTGFREDLGEEGRDGGPPPETERGNYRNKNIDWVEPSLERANSDPFPPLKPQADPGREDWRESGSLFPPLKPRKEPKEPVDPEDNLHKPWDAPSVPSDTDIIAPSPKPSRPPPPQRRRRGRAPPPGGRRRAPLPERP